MRMRGDKMVVAMLGLAVVAGCNSPGSARNSAIVRQVEAAGAGNLDRHPSLIAPFFDKHVELAKSLGDRCAKASLDAAPGGKLKFLWGNTTEGMVCNQAGEVAEYGAGARDAELERTVHQFTEY